MHFSIVCNLVHKGRKKSSMRIALLAAIHEAFRSQIFIWIMNDLRLCSSYDEVLSIDTAHSHCTIDMAGSHHVLVPRSIVPSELVHWVMCNVNHEENTLSGIDASHDTILMLFQNITNTELVEKHR